MQKNIITLVALPIFLVGCSPMGGTYNFAQNLSNAGMSEDPAKVLLQGAVKDASNNLATLTAKTIDQGIANSRTNVSITGVEKNKPNFSILNVTGLGLGTTDSRQTFVQSSVRRMDARTTLNLGFGQRYLNADETLLTGFNVFFDYDANYGHQRASIGGEIKSSALGLTANGYEALTKWKTGKNSSRERALDGYDIELGVQVPYIPGGRLYAKNWKWDVDGGTDVKGNTFALAFSHLFGYGLSLELGTKDFDGAAADQDFVKVTYGLKLGEPSERSSSFFSNSMFERTSMAPNMLDEVRRNNAIVVEVEFTAGVGGV